MTSIPNNNKDIMQTEDIDVYFVKFITTLHKQKDNTMIPE